MFSEQLLGLPVQLTVPIEPRVPCAGGVMTVKVRALPSGSEPVRVIARGVSSFADRVLESAVGAWLFWIVTVVVAERVLVVQGVVESVVTVGAVVSCVPVTFSLAPVFGVGVATSVTQTRSVFEPTARSAAAIDVLTVFGEDE